MSEGDPSTRAQGPAPAPPTVVLTPSQGVIGVATGTVDALRGSPMLLVMVLLNCAFLGAAAYYLRSQQDHAFSLVRTMFDRCLPVPPPFRYQPPDSGSEHPSGSLRQELRPQEGLNYPPSPIGELETK